MRQMIGHKYKRRDPAPSVMSYRFMRIMLSPVLRKLVFFGIPIFILVMGVSIYLLDQQRRDIIIANLYDIQRSVIERPEFMVKALAISGASRALEVEIRQIMPVDFPISQFDFDIEHIHSVVSSLPPVKEAQVQIRTNGVLQLNIIERTPAYLWRVDDGLKVLDGSGHFIRFTDARLNFAHLPVIAGLGADQAVSELRQLLTVSAPILDRVRGFVRIGQRRWDVELENDLRIMLPQDAPVSALQRVLVLDQARDVLSRDIMVVDMRISERPTVRMGKNASTQFHQLIQIQLKGQSR